MPIQELSVWFYGWNLHGVTSEKCMAIGVHNGCNLIIWNLTFASSLVAIRNLQAPPLMAETYLSQRPFVAATQFQAAASIAAVWLAATPFFCGPKAICSQRGYVLYGSNETCCYCILLLRICVALYVCKVSVATALYGWGVMFHSWQQFVPMSFSGCIVTCGCGLQRLTSNVLAAAF